MKLTNKIDSSLHVRDVELYSNYIVFRINCMTTLFPALKRILFLATVDFINDDALIGTISVEIEIVAVTIRTKTQFEKIFPFLINNNMQPDNELLDDIHKKAYLEILQ